MAITLARSSIVVRPALGQAAATRNVRARASAAPKGLRTPLRVSAGVTMPKAVTKAQEKMGEMSVEHLAALGALSALTTANPCLAATEIAQVADDRLGIFFLLFGPVLGWVGFNILPGFINQIDDMKKGAAIGVGLSAATLLAAPHAQAATEVMQVADNRLSIFFLLFGPVLGWVAFNILGPFSQQLDNMKSKGLAAGLGLSAAALLAAPSAQAATEVAQIADDRLGIFFLLFGPVLGWVGFNILPGFINQIDDMKKGAAIGVGLSAATLLAAPHAQAATEIAQIADDRLGIFFLLFGPVLGWVGFNILPGFINQIDDMKTKGLAAGLGLSAAALLAAPSAQAATEVAQIADDRLGIFFLLFGPVLGWVGFNILPGFINQIDDMKKSAAIGVGLSAATLLAAPHAQAATEVAQIADDRLGIFFLLFGPVLGWVGFNILPGFINQIDDMKK